MIDVRSNPHSKIYLDYNKEVLEKTLDKNKYRIDFICNKEKYHDLYVIDIKLKNKYKSVGDYSISG